MAAVGINNAVCKKDRGCEITMKLARLAPITAALTLVIVTAAPVLAHPLGNLSVNRYSRLEVGAQSVRLVYIIDRAEIPAFQEKSRMDANGDGVISEAEQLAYLKRETPQISANLAFQVDGVQVQLKPVSQTIEFPIGTGGLNTQRMVLVFEAALPDDHGAIRYGDDNFMPSLGWQEMVVRAGRGVKLSGDYPTKELSNELRVYADDLLAKPPGISSVTFDYESGIVADELPQSSTGTGIAASTSVPAVQAFVSELLSRKELSLGAILLTLLGSIVWGAAHAMSPGHGKTIVAAYLIGSRATSRHALFLGLTTTITHTAGVFALGLLTVVAARYFVAERYFPYLEALSGALVVWIGLLLVWNRLKPLLRKSGSGAHQHVDDHAHVHEDAVAHTHDHGDGHVHTHEPPTEVTWRSLLSLGISGGLLPCPSALVLLLSAIALNRAAFGLILVVAFSAGLAGTLTVVGLLMVRAKDIFTKFAARNSQRRLLPYSAGLLRLAPVFSALVITLAGGAITWNALAQAGVL